MNIGNARGSPHRCVAVADWDSGALPDETEWVDVRGMRTIMVYIKTVGISGVFNLDASYDGVADDGEIASALAVNDADGNILTEPAPFVRVSWASLGGAGTMTNVWIYGIPG